MKRFVIVVAFLVVGTGAWPQTIKPVVLIKAKDGSGPGEYALDAEDYVFPPPIIDDQENIYILDTFNNRVQYYDSTGNYLGAIPIKSSEPPTEGEDNPTVDRIRFIDGNIYAIRRLCRGNPNDHECRVGYLLKRAGNSFVNADDDGNAALIRKKLMLHPIVKAQKELPGEFIGLGLTRESFFTRYPAEKNEREYLYRLVLDKNKNLWCFGSSIKVFSPTGTLIYGKDIMGYNTILSKRGNFYMLMNSFEDSEGGYVLSVTKYSLQGQ